jgi:hypothetical protein
MSAAHKKENLLSVVFVTQNDSNVTFVILNEHLITE